MFNRLSGLFKKKRQTLPVKARLEACTLCQLDCKGCFMRLENNCDLGTGYLKLSDFIKFTKLNPQIKTIELSSAGEIFLNPDLKEIIKYAYENKISLTASGGVNFNDVSDEMLDALVKYKFEHLTISISGWNQISYETYHKGGNFDKVIANIKKLNELKTKYNSQLPFLTWKFIVVESTDDFNGIRIAQNLAYELGYRIEFARDCMGYRSYNVQNNTDDRKLTFQGFDIPCSQLWLEPQINWDGRFMGCNANHYYFYDNANLFEIPLSEYLERPIIKNTKQMLMGQSCAGECNPYCQKLCHHYTVMKAEKHFISEKDLESGNVMKVTI